MNPTCPECELPIKDGQMFMADRDEANNRWVARHDVCVTKHTTITDKTVWQMSPARAWVLTKGLA